MGEVSRNAERFLSRFRNVSSALQSVPIYFKILGIGVLVAFIFGSITLYHVQKKLASHLYTNLKETALNRTRTLAELIELPLITGDYYKLRKVVENSTKEIRELKYIILVDSRDQVMINLLDGVRFYHTSLFSFPHRASEQGLVQILKNDDELVFDVTISLLRGNGGKLRMGYSDKTIRVILTEITTSLLWTLALCLVIGQCLALVLSFLISHPLHQLVEVTNKLRAGEFGIRAHRYSQDEIGLLSSTFNLLARDLDLYKRRVKLKERERLSLVNKVISVQEAERKYIARELHDQFGQSLSSLNLLIHKSRKECTADDEHFKSIQDKIITLIDELRRLAWNLRPSILDDYGLDSALQRLVESLRPLKKMELDYQLITDEPGRRMANSLEISLYRIAQEALNNALRHSQCKAVSVVLVIKKEHVTLVIEDDGIGFDVHEVKGRQNSHLGLISMRERVTLMKGSFIIESTSGQGTTVKITIPLDYEKKTN